MISIPHSSGESTAQLVVLKELDFETQPKRYKLGLVAYNKNALNKDDPRYEVSFDE